MGLLFCQCGCGGRVTKPGNKFILGHSLKRLIPWNKGLTKETDYRVAKLSKDKKIPTEIRICKCGCEENFTCRINSLQQFIHCHYVRVFHPTENLKTREKIRNSLKGRSAHWMEGDKHPMKNPITAKKNADVRRGKPHFSIQGEKHYNWQGGISFLPYPSEWTEELKESVRNRDGRLCQLCDKTEEQNGRKLEVHHIDSDKDNCKQYNLISLCLVCHAKTKSLKHREFYQVVLTELISNG